MVSKLPETAPPLVTCFPESLALGGPSVSCAPGIVGGCRGRNTLLIYSYFKSYCFSLYFYLPYIYLV
jgi:hypothetical protein